MVLLLGKLTQESRFNDRSKIKNKEETDRRKHHMASTCSLTHMCALTLSHVSMYSLMQPTTNKQ